MPEMEVVGRACASLRSEDLVTGRARFTADLRFPGMLVGKILYTSHPCAQIKRLDVSVARSLPGIRAVLTHQDMPGENTFCHVVPDQPIFASSSVRFQGEALAAIAAEDEAAADKALSAIEVEYEIQAGVYDPQIAMEPDAWQVWPDRKNVCAHWQIDQGDVVLGFEQADVIIENTYHTQHAEHAFLETESAVALMEQDGTLLVYSCCQAPHAIRRQIARALGLPTNRVRVVVTHVGGAFGGKSESHVEIYAALLSMKTMRSVRVVRSREESILVHGKRHPIIINYRTGAKADGKLTAIHVRAIGDTGPYLGPGPFVMGAFAETSPGPYIVPNVRVEAYTVHTNNPNCTAFRGFGVAQATFAHEAQMDALARALKIDPLDIRKSNCLTTGTMLPTGAVIREGSALKACLEEVAKKSKWRTRNRIQRTPAGHLRRGWGMAACWHLIGFGGKAPNHAGVMLDMAEDGSLLLRTGVVDVGQGTHTALAQIAAEALGIEVSRVRVVGPDTDTTSDAGSVEASRSVYISGNAVIRAAQPIRQALLETAAEETGLPVKDLCLRRGRLYAGDELLSMSVSQLAHTAGLRNRQLHSHGFYAMERPEGYPENEHFPFSHQVFSYGAQVARVLVDIETGQVVVEEVSATNGVGRIVNPKSARGQVEGGFAMGLGLALMEKLTVNQGRTLTSSLKTYLIPTSVDVPRISVGFMEEPEPLAPYGAKGLGELATNAAVPAIINAISDAVGVQYTHTPLLPESILEGIASRQ